MHSKPRHLDECELSASHSDGINFTESQKILYKSFRVSRENRLLASTCPSVRIHKLCSKGNDFHEISYWRLPLKCRQKPDFVKIGQKITRFTRKLNVLFIAAADIFVIKVFLTTTCSTKM